MTIRRSSRPGSQGALACVTRSQRNLELMGVKTPTTDDAVEELSFREAILPPSLRELRQKLGQKAKQAKRYRFYSLYALVCRSDVLQAAFAAVRRNDGAPGVDLVNCFLEETTWAKAGWGKAPCPV